MQWHSEDHTDIQATDVSNEKIKICLSDKDSVSARENIKSVFFEGREKRGESRSRPLGRQLTYFWICVKISCYVHYAAFEQWLSKTIYYEIHTCKIWCLNIMEVLQKEYFQWNVTVQHWFKTKSFLTRRSVTQGHTLNQGNRANDLDWNAQRRQKYIFCPTQANLKEIARNWTEIQSAKYTFDCMSSDFFSTCLQQ